MRVTFASLLSSLAHQAKRFLETSQVVKQQILMKHSGSSTNPEFLNKEIPSGSNATSALNLSKIENVSNAELGKTDTSHTTDNTQDLLHTEKNDINLDIISNTTDSDLNSTNANTPISSIPDSGVNAYGGYDTELSLLRDEFADMMLKLHSGSAAVKRALLSDIAQLCIFFGRRRTNDFVLPLVITFLNSREWELRNDFFKKIVGVAVFVGPISLREFILPIMIQAINDMEEFVVDSILNALISLCEIGLFNKRTLIYLSSVITPLLHHPNSWIKFASVSLVSCISKQLGPTDTCCFLLSVLQPHLSFSIMLATEHALMESVKSSINRKILTQALTVAYPTNIMEQHSHDNRSTSTNQKPRFMLLDNGTSSSANFTENKIKSDNDHLNDDTRDDQSPNRSNKEISVPWNQLLGVEISNKDRERLSLMKSYIIPTSL